MGLQRFACSRRSSRRGALALVISVCPLAACSNDSGHANSPAHAGAGGASSGGAGATQAGGTSNGSSGASAANSGGSSGDALVDHAGASNASSGAPAVGGQGDASNASSGAPDTGGEGGGSGAAEGSLACKNPTHVLPLNPSNPQDGIMLGAFYVDTDTWNAAKYAVKQTMYVCDYDNWYVVANMNDTGDGAVKTYPNVHEDFTASPEISSFNAISSSFAHRGPHVGIYEFAYDIWLNGVATKGSTEVMIWTDNYHQVPSGSVIESVTFDEQTYQVYKSGSYIAFVETTNTTSGTVNLLSFFNHIIDQGWIPATSTLGAIDYGVELVSTGGADATFELTDFSLTAD
jgi:hypothetical protein